ncbi:UNVERIFIED_CONTAM: Major facilitator superfamily domain-containing protein 12 [Sesamum latifolium]|uniref:Major facilitator superfamily domain-containing protein 12 n=1 Tax=Sesamum latifolium TaxID=2727402 RepID=A0AAW2YF01_9LAMI
MAGIPAMMNHAPSHLEGALSSIMGDAAVVMLSGQIADGFTTVFAGELIDRYGHFKIWHGAGSLLVAVSFSSVFGGCLPCKIIGSNSSSIQTIGYSFFAAIFNVGWAATQVSHMSMVNCITLNSTSRVVLASCRNAFTMVANLSLYAVAFVVFNINTAGSVIDVENQYRWIAYTSIFIGCCFVCVFHLGTEEPRLKREAHEKGHARISWTYWFNKLLYYQVALVYVLTRLVTNVSQAFLAFYVINDLQMTQSSKALVPAVIYICSFIISILLQEVTWTGQRLKAFYSAGGLLWVISGAAILFLPSSMKAFMYILSIAIGIANALMMVSGVSMQSFLVGSTPEVRSNCPHPSFHFSVTRYGLGLVPAICALVGVLVTLSMKLPEPTLTPLTDPLLANGPGGYVPPHSSGISEVVWGTGLRYWKI